MVERATASTATEKGVPTNSQVTLGQVKLMLANSNERIMSTAKFYKIARREFGEKWYNFLMANEKWIKPVKLYKQSLKGNYFEATIKPSDWKDEMGYKCKVVSTSERSQKTIEEVQKLQAIAGLFPNNLPLKKIMKKKSLDLIDDLSAEEIKDVMDFDEQAGNNIVTTPNDTTTVPANPQVPDTIGA